MMGQRYSKEIQTCRFGKDGLNSIFDTRTIVSNVEFATQSFRGDEIAAMARILVVDDEADVRKVVGILLAQAGYQVTEAEYGLSGYHKAQSDNPDLIVLDLLMPVMDGFEVLQKLKETPATREIPVVILTAKIDAASERECMRLGAVDYIKKPWGPRELEERIGMALGYPDLTPLTTFISDDPPVEAEEGDLDGSDLNEPRKFRTRSFPARGDGVDPESLV